MKRKYFRKCGVCGERHEQSEMIRTEQSPTGWICLECYEAGIKAAMSIVHEVFNMSEEATEILLKEDV